MKLASRILFVLTTVMICGSAYAQVGQGSIYGKIVDREGKPLQAAVVQVEHLTTHQTDDAKTNKNGQYSISGLFQGQYKVTVVVNGRAAMVKGAGAGDAIYVAPGLDVAVNFDLRNAPATNSITTQDTEKAKAPEKKSDAEMRAAFSAGVAALKANNYEEAIKQFKAAAEKDPSQPAISQNLALALINMSSALADAGKLDEAVPPLEEASKLNPSTGAQGYYNLGTVLMNRGKSKEAVDAFNKAIALDANYAKPYYQLGIAYFGSVNTMQQAVSALEKFLQLNPNGPDAETAKQLVETAKPQLKN